MRKKLDRQQIIELFEQARNAHGLCERMLEMDSTGKRIPRQDRPGLISTVLKTGRDWATALRDQYPGKDIESVAQKMGVQVEISDQGIEVGNMLIRAEYYAQPPRVVIFRKSITALQDLMEQVGLPTLFAPDLAIPLHVLHELFHHVERLRQDFLAKRYLVTTFRLGPLRLRSEVRVLGEMGAHAFAQSWLNLDWYPFVIDQINRLTAGEAISPTEQLNQHMKNRGLERIFFPLGSGKGKNSRG